MNAFVRLYDRLIAALRIVASGLVALMCILVLFDVTMRTLGVKIPAFSITVVEYSLLYLAMSAAPWLVEAVAWPGSCSLAHACQADPASLMLPRCCNRAQCRTSTNRP